MSADRGLWIDLHGHAGRCFLAGHPAGHPMVASLGAASVAGAVRDAAAAGMTVLTLATVSDFAVLRPDPVIRAAGTAWSIRTALGRDRVGNCADECVWWEWRP